MGGAGSDLIEGRGGDDVIDGDAQLNVRISVRSGVTEPTTRDRQRREAAPASRRASWPARSTRVSCASSGRSRPRRTAPRSTRRCSPGRWRTTTSPSARRRRPWCTPGTTRSPTAPTRCATSSGSGSPTARSRTLRRSRPRRPPRRPSPRRRATRRRPWPGTAPANTGGAPITELPDPGPDRDDGRADGRRAGHTHHRGGHRPDQWDGVQLPRPGDHVLRSRSPVRPVEHGHPGDRWPQRPGPRSPRPATPWRI